ncbi:MAG TPA: hypothetical protein VN812_16130 [Candidatus Acidoferrales bacterium]|nr:hypothetical protein [Candidatus Acidoferrales bacterium]
MDSRDAYEKQIASELRALPQAALAEVLRLVAVVREKYRARSASPDPTPDGRASHERTRQLLASSKSNWAQGLIREREDRL